jgi:ABC-type phosphate/phosphonate transport system substrate-binding protein
MRIACFPWYDLPETRAAQAELWSSLARALRRAGIDDVPDRLTRQVAIPSVLSDPRLLIGQCCGYDLLYGFAGSTAVIATPRYAAAGCEGSRYRSFVLVRHESGIEALAELRGGVCAINSFNSHSGANALRPLVAPLARDGRFFARVVVTGAHVNSLALVCSGEADVMAIDCVLHALLARHRPESLLGTRILCATELAPAPPFITSAATPPGLARALSAALAETLADPATQAPRAEMLLDGVDPLPVAAYDRILDFEEAALRRGYRELHATSPALARDMPRPPPGG